MESNRKKESPPRVHAEMVVRYPGCRCNLFSDLSETHYQCLGTYGFPLPASCRYRTCFRAPVCRSLMEQKDIE